MKIDGLLNSYAYPKNFLKENSEVSLDFNAIMQNLREADTASFIKKNKAGMHSEVEHLLPEELYSSFKRKGAVPKYKDVLPKETERTFEASGSIVYKGNVVDKTTELYAQALELESYFVKIMLTSMRNTLTGSGLTGDNSFASKMYKDMFYDELNKGITRNAGFGLADQIYLQLNGK